MRTKYEFQEKVNLSWHFSLPEWMFLGLLFACICSCCWDSHRERCIFDLYTQFLIFRSNYRAPFLSKIQYTPKFVHDSCNCSGFRDVDFVSTVGYIQREMESDYRISSACAFCDFIFQTIQEFWVFDIIVAIYTEVAAPGVFFCKLWIRSIDRSKEYANCDWWSLQFVRIWIEDVFKELKPHEKATVWAYFEVWKVVRLS
jgi:hypothetical protein